MVPFKEASFNVESLVKHYYSQQTNLCYNSYVYFTLLNSSVVTFVLGKARVLGYLEGTRKLVELITNVNSKGECRRVVNEAQVFSSPLYFEAA